MRISKTLVCGLLLALGAAACGDDDAALPDAGTPDAGPGLDAAADAGAESWRWESIEPPAEGPISVWGYMPVPMDGARAVLFGGTTLNAFGGGAVLDDLWQWDASGAAPTFTRLTPTGTAPSARYCGCGAYDPTRNRVLFFGGREALSPASTTPGSSTSRRTLGQRSTQRRARRRVRLVAGSRTRRRSTRSISSAVLTRVA